MATKNVVYVGLLILTLLSSGVVYIALQDAGIKMRVDDYKSTFYVLNDNNRFIVAGREYNRLFDGTKGMNRDKSTIYVKTTYDNLSKITTVERYTGFQRGPVIKDTYTFDGAISDIELFPIEHKVEIINAKGYFYRYSVDDLEGTGAKRKLSGETELSFGLNMKVELNPNYRWAWVGYPYGSDSLAAQYDIDSDYEVFNFRLFDPLRIVNLTCNSLETAAKYEFNTTAECTATINESVQVCIDIDDASDNTTNITCGTSSVNYNYTIDLLRQNQFNDSTTSKNLSSSGNITIDMINKTDLILTNFNLTGYNSPTNISVNVYNQLQAMLPGTLLGNNLEINRFVFSNIYYTTHNLSYSAEGSNTIYLNASTSSFNPVNLTFNISGFDIDAGNDFDFTERFNNTNGTTNLINETDSTTEEALTFWENFENIYYNSSGRWDTSTAASCPSPCDSCGTWSTLLWSTGNSDDYYELSKSETGSGPHNCKKTYTAKLFEEELDITNISRVDIKWYYSLSAINSPGQLCQSNSLTASIQFTDGTNVVNMFSRSISPHVSQTSSDTENISIRYTSNDDWDIYVDDVYSSTVSTLALSDSSLQKIQIFGQNVNYRDASRTCTTTIDIKTYHVSVSAATLNRTETGENYTLTGNVSSKRIFNAPTNITAATLDTVELTPTNTSISYYLSNNNGSTWESIAKGIRHVFSSVGNELKWKAELTTTNTTITPIIYSIDVDVIPTAVTNITVDLGSDYGVDYNLTTFLNGTNSPQLVTFSSLGGLNSYQGTNCANDKTCLIPIKIGSESGGIIQVNNFNFTQNPNPIVMNTTKLETCETCGVNLDFTNGIVNIDDVKFDYLGSKNITMTAHEAGDYTNNDTFEFRVKYSKFNLSLPPGIFWWDFFATGNSQKNITPYGQTVSRAIWNVTNQAYEEPFDMYVKANNTLNSCINITFSNSSTKGNIKINTTSQKLISSQALNTYQGLWNWIDLTSCSSSFYIPWFYFSAICSDCVKTFDFDLTNWVLE